MKLGVLLFLVACGATQSAVPESDAFGGRRWSIRMPLTYWGVAVDHATYLVLAKDPRQDVNALVHPREVYLRGRRLR